MYFPFNLWWLFLFPWTLLHLTVVTLLLRTRLLPAFLLCVVHAAQLTNALEASSTLWVFQILLVRLVISFSLCVWIPCSFAHMGNWAVRRERKRVVMRSKASPRGANVQQVGSGWWWLVELPAQEARQRRTRFPLASPCCRFPVFLWEGRSDKKKKSAVLPRFLLACKFSYLVVGVWGRRGIRIKWLLGRDKM